MNNSLSDLIAIHPELPDRFSKNFQLVILRTANLHFLSWINGSYNHWFVVAMRFSLPSFVRKCGFESVLAYLAYADCEPSAGFVRPGKPKDANAAIVAWIEDSDEAIRNRIYSDMEAVEQLADEVGQRALRSAIMGNSSLLKEMCADESDQARGLRVLLEDKNGFENALAINQAERWRHGRNWSGYIIGSGLVQKKYNQLPDHLREELAQVFSQVYGTRGRLFVEQFERGAPNGADRIVQTTIYAESNPQTLMVVEKEGVSRHVLRPAIEAAVTYEPETGKLDVFSGGGEGYRRTIAKAYAEHMFDNVGDPEHESLRKFELSCLKRPMQFATDPEDGIESVSLVQLRLFGEQSNQTRLTIEIGAKSHRTIWDTSRSLFGSHDPLRGTGWLARYAELKICFRCPKGRKRQPTMRVTLRHPNGCNLKDQTERERLIGEKYLERWGLVRRVI